MTSIKKHVLIRMLSDFIPYEILNYFLFFFLKNQRLTLQGPLQDSGSVKQNLRSPMYFSNEEFLFYKNSRVATFCFCMYTYSNYAEINEVLED